jgi:hypothetical protein
VAFVDVEFPPTAMLDASVAADPEVSDEDRERFEERPNAIPPQRLGFCVQHAADHELTGPITAGRAVKGTRAKGRFPAEHALVDSWSWTVA